MKCLLWCDRVMTYLLLGIYFGILLGFGAGFIYKGLTTEEMYYLFYWNYNSEFSFSDPDNLFQNAEDLINSAGVSSAGLVAYIVAGSVMIFVAVITVSYLCCHREYFSYVTRIIKVF